MIGAVALAAQALQVPSACALPTGWTLIEARRPRFIVFGETHGTRESPELVGSVACALAGRRQRILVAVELGAYSDAQLRELWKTPVDGFADRVIKGLRGFAGRLDGVGSKAMLALLVKLHALARAGKQIDIVAFNGARSADQAEQWKSLPGQGPHEAEQAENISIAAAKAPYRYVLVLAGNLHARKLPIDDSDASFEPMAMHLGRTGPVVSLNEIYATGTMWNCVRRPAPGGTAGASTAAGVSDCGDHKTRGDLARPPTQVGFWRTRQDSWNVGFDGYYWFPVVHGSPPASAAPAN